jgi:anti-sigma B factor antagonist
MPRFGLSLEIAVMSSVPTQVFQFTTRQVGDVTVVEFQDRKLLDELGLVHLGQRLLALVDGGVRKLVLSFKQVGALSSAALGKLFQLHKRLVEELHGEIVLCCLVEHLREVFQVMCLDRKFPIVKDEGEALRRFQGGTPENA